MLTLPAALLSLLREFAPLFSRARVETRASLVGRGDTAPGKRTVTACLRVMGLSHETHFVNYHRVLNRARWSALAASRYLAAPGGHDVRSARRTGLWS